MKGVLAGLIVGILQFTPCISAQVEPIPLGTRVTTHPEILTFPGGRAQSVEVEIQLRDVQSGPCTPHRHTCTGSPEGFYVRRAVHHFAQPPEAVEYVFCTHFHVDHVGWKVNLVDGSPLLPVPAICSAAPNSIFTLLGSQPISRPMSRTACYP